MRVAEGRRFKSASSPLVADRSGSPRTAGRGERLILAAILILGLLTAGACARPGIYENRPPADSGGWRRLRPDEREAVRARLEEEKVVIRQADLDSVRIPVNETPYLNWTDPYVFLGTRVHIEFRLVRYQRDMSGNPWPSSFTITRLPGIDSDGLQWAPGELPALTGIGVVRYHWDMYVPATIESRHCRLYEWQLDRHERQHIRYRERLIKKLQDDGEDLVSRLRAPRNEPGPSDSGGTGGHEGGGTLQERRAAFLGAVSARFVQELPSLRDRYWTTDEEEKRVAKESFQITDADREDLEANCLLRSE